MENNKRKKVKISYTKCKGNRQQQMLLSNRGRRSTISTMCWYGRVAFANARFCVVRPKYSSFRYRYESMDVRGCLIEDRAVVNFILFPYGAASEAQKVGHPSRICHSLGSYRPASRLLIVYDPPCFLNVILVGNSHLHPILLFQRALVIEVSLFLLSSVALERSAQSLTPVQEAGRADAFLAAEIIFSFVL